MLTEILQSLGVLALAMLGASIGAWFGRRRSAAWSVGFILPLIFVLMIAMNRRSYPLSFVVPFRWMSWGRLDHALLGFFASMTMATPIMRLPRVRTRAICFVFLGVFVIHSCVMPFLMAGLQKQEIAGLKTRLPADGVCRQSTEYTCGPAATVTALHAVGINAGESEIALLSHCNRITGSEPRVLEAILNQQYADKHATFTYQPFDHARDLPRDRPTIAVVNFKYMVDHYVAVLKVTDDGLLIGDPLVGEVKQTFEQFESTWRRVGIVVDKR